jgi:tRNA dimethylallyltransferase
MTTEGSDKLYDQLVQIDPDLAQKLQKNDKQRIIRGLEVYLKTGNRLSELQELQTTPADLTPLMFGLTGPREWLYQKINTRVDDMFHQGFLAEAANLKLKGYGLRLNALNTVGYREIFDYLDNNIDYDSMIELIQQNSRKYAKRQLTWFRKDKRITWIDVGEDSDFSKIADTIVVKYRELSSDTS